MEIKKKILMIGANRNNATDGVIVAGMRNLLKNYDIDYAFLFDSRDQDEKDFNPNTKYDFLMIAGTPWIWDQFQHSTKWRNMLKCRQTHWQVPVIFFGIGSCINISDEQADIMRRPEDIISLQKTFRDSVVFVRDSLAHDYLLNAGVEHDYFVCPSFFCYDEFPYPTVGTENILVWYDPTIGVSRGDWNENDVQNQINEESKREKIDEELIKRLNQKKEDVQKKLANYLLIVKEYVKKYNPKVYCADPAEVNSAKELIGVEPSIIKGWSHTLEIMKNANYVLSGRVHNFIPAFVQGKACGLLPIDSRHKVASDFGGLLINSVEDLDKMKAEQRDFEKYRKCFDFENKDRRNYFEVLNKWAVSTVSIYELEKELNRLDCNNFEIFDIKITAGNISNIIARKKE